MSRRIATVLAIAASAAFAQPAAADRECFDSTCRMPEVIEVPEAPSAVEEPENAVAASPVTVRRGAAPEPIRPQMSVDALPRPALKPSPYRPAEVPDKPVRQNIRSTSNEPVEVLNRRYAAAEPPGYALSTPSHPGAGVVIVVPGVQYGADGVGLLEGRQNSAWGLCQSDRGNDGRCSPYNYQPYGPYGYRPLGSYRPQRAAPAYVYVPDAKIVTIESND